MLRKVLAVLGLCCFVCTLSACSGGPGPVEKKEPKNKPGTSKDGEVNPNDSTAAGLVE